MQTVQVHTPLTDYPILIGAGMSVAGSLPPRFQDVLRGRRCFVISDSSVDALYGNRLDALLREFGGIPCGCHAFPPGERSKTLATVEAIYHDMLAAGLDRQSMVVALGGGVPGDIAGFAAATYMRGIAFVQVPTSLLAMVDSSVGGKTGVDLAEGKNLVGAFHHPRAVLADTSVLETLPLRELRSGLAEVVKYGVIMDAGFFTWLEQRTDALVERDADTYRDVVVRCCELKAQIVRDDEREQSGRRAVLNYGHTFAHALEVCGDYGSLNHGEAVAVGMGMAADLAVALGMCEPSLAVRQEKLLARLGLPTRCTAASFDSREILHAMLRDKKTRAGTLRLILPCAVGEVRACGDVAQDALLRAIGGRCGQS